MSKKIITEDYIYNCIKNNGEYTLSDGKRKIIGSVMKQSAVWEKEEHEQNFGGCFRKGTLVNTPKGMVAIETLTQGAKIFSYNEQTHEVEIDRLVELVRTDDVELGELFISNSLRNYTQIECSAKHHYYLPRKTEWVAASELKVEDNLLSINFFPRTVTMKWKCERFRETVYNLHVEKNKNYYVHGILVHNMMKA